jgi:hypothetical protein
MGKKIRIRDEQPGSYFLELRNNFWVKILKFFDAARDPGWKKFGSGIRDKHPGSATWSGSVLTARPRSNRSGSTTLEWQVTSSTHGVKSRTNVTTKNGRYYLKQNLLEKDVGVAIIFKVEGLIKMYRFILSIIVCLNISWHSSFSPVFSILIWDPDLGSGMENIPNLGFGWTYSRIK